MQSKGFATCLRTKGDTASNGMTQQIVHGALIQIFQLQVTVLSTPHQQINRVANELLLRQPFQK